MVKKSNIAVNMKNHLGRTLQERFEEKIFYSPDGCWYWLGHTGEKGYGYFRSYGGKTMTSHRVSYILKNGSIGTGLHVLHKCDNRSCVNPDHLFVGTNKDNVDDRLKKGRFHGRNKFGLSYTINGVTKSHNEWCEIYKIAINTAYQRIYRNNWPIEKAFSTPLKSKYQ